MTKDKEALFKAVITNNIEEVKRVINKGINVNAKNYDINLFQESLLHEASSYSYKEIVKILINAGAYVNVKDYSGQTPLHRAVRYENNIEITKLLIDADADVNAKDYHQKTPLHQAVIYRNRKTIELLIAHGANTKDINFNTKNRYMLYPLHFSLFGLIMLIVFFII